MPSALLAGQRGLVSEWMLAVCVLLLCSVHLPALPHQARTAGGRRLLQANSGGMGPGNVSSGASSWSIILNMHICWCIPLLAERQPLQAWQR